MRNRKRGLRFLLICLLGIFTVAVSYGQTGLIVPILGDKVAPE